MFARRQVEHGDFLSQRTFRVLQTTQLRTFCVDEDTGADACAEVVLPKEDAGDVALFSEDLAVFSELAAEALSIPLGDDAADTTTGGT